MDIQYHFTDFLSKWGCTDFMEFSMGNVNVGLIAYL